MNRLAALLGLRPDERALVGWTAVLFAVTQSGHGLGANTGDALFFVHFGVEYLPHMIAASGVLAIIGSVAYGTGLSRFGSRAFLPVLAWGLAALLVLQRVAVTTDAAAVYAGIWLTEQLTILLTFTLMWNVAAEVCDTRQAKRLFPLLASAGIGGGMVGNLLTGPLATALGTSNLLVVHGGLLVGSGLLALAVTRRFAPAAQPGRRRSFLADLRSGYDLTRGSRLLRLVAITAVAFSVLFFLVVFPFSEEVAASFGTDQEIASFLGYFSGAATAASFVVSLLVANRLFARIGVVAVVLIVPVVYLLGLGVWAVTFTLATAAAVRGLQWVAVNALGGTAFASLFTVVSPSRRGVVVAFMTGVPTQLGVVLGGVLLVVVAPLVSTPQLALGGVVVAAATCALVLRMRPAYRDALMDAVRKGLVGVLDTTAAGLGRTGTDADVLRAVEEALDDERPAVRRVATALLEHLDGEATVRLLERSSGDPDPRVRTAALRCLHGGSDTRVAPIALRRLADPEPAIRMQALEVLARSGSPADGDAPALERAVADPSPAVRAGAAALLRTEDARALLETMLRSDDGREVEAALQALRWWPDVPAGLPVADRLHDERAPVRLAAVRVLAEDATYAGDLVPLLDDPDPGVRAEVAEALRPRHELSHRLVELLRHGSERAQDAAVSALTSHPDGVDALRERVLDQIERAHHLRGLRERVADSAHAPMIERYLRTVLGQREEAHLARSLRALEAIIGQDAGGLLTRGAGAYDQHVRAQALEAVDEAFDRPLTRSLLPLLEDEPDPRDETDRGALWALLDDADGWLRALAARAIADRARTDLTALHRQMDDDPSPLVAVATGPNGAAVETAADTLDLIDRILCLQQVAMFSELAPEDLRRIAEQVEERRYAPEEVIYRFGDSGDEMLVIASGRVRISKEVDGEVRFLGTYGAGEHVGELGLLRGQPRAADVICDGEEVVGLALSSENLRSILMERPEAAMAMLGTLADRLGTSA